jgi:shikimate kinase
MAERVLLVGMMGAGKTTVGRELSKRLGWPYFDSDAMVEAHTGKTVPEIFEERGEAAFRAEEARALAEAVTSDGPAVVSVAGGAVLDPDNRRRLAGGGTVVWLRADVETLAQRVGAGRGRPLLSPDPETALRRLYLERRPIYEEVADVVVDVDHRSAADVAAAILAELDR